jgi:hypothetical protein
MKNLVFLVSFVFVATAQAETGAAFSATSKPSLLTNTKVTSSGKTNSQKKNNKKKDSVIVTSSTLKNGKTSVLVRTKSGINKDVVSLEVRGDDSADIEVIECFESANKAYANTCLPVGSLSYKKAPSLLALTDNFKMRQLVAEMMISATKNKETDSLRKVAAKMDFNDYVAGLYSLHNGFAEMEYRLTTQNDQK